MPVNVKIPTPLRGLTGERDTVTAEAATLSDLVTQLEQDFPGMRERLCEADGQLRRFVNVYINGEDVRFLDGLGSTLKAGDEVSIVPAVAGGA